jgi:hypothetical protein
VPPGIAGERRHAITAPDSFALEPFGDLERAGADRRIIAAVEQPFEGARDHRPLAVIERCMIDAAIAQERPIPHQSQHRIPLGLRPRELNQPALTLRQHPRPAPPALILPSSIDKRFGESRQHEYARADADRQRHRAAGALPDCKRLHTGAAGRAGERGLRRRSCAASRRYRRLRELDFPPAAIKRLLAAREGAPFSVAPGVALVIDPSLLGSDAPQGC